MKTHGIARVAAVAGALLLIGATALAQPPAAGGAGRGQGRGQGQGRQGARGLNVSQLPVEVLDAIVKLTPDQKTKIKAIHDKLAADRKAAGLGAPGQPGQPGAGQDPAARQKAQELGRQAANDIQNVLTQEQKDKLRTAAQELGPIIRSGIPVGVIFDLKLSADQKAKIGAIAQETQTKMQGAQGQDRRAIMQDARTKVEALLTAEQKAKLEKYMKEHPRGGGRRGGGA